MVIAMKKSNGIHICIDPKILNKGLKWERYKQTSEVLLELINPKYFLNLDYTEYDTKLHLGTKIHFWSSDLVKHFNFY